MSKKDSKDKKDSKEKKDSGPHVCAGCKNFKPGKGGTGYCKRRDKKRDEDDKACGHYNPR